MITWCQPRHPLRRVGSSAVLLSLLTLVFLAACAPTPPPAAAATHVTIAARYSRFEPAVVTVRAGTAVTFTLRNDDPIEHEWLIGSAESHAAHRTGTEPHHDSRPDEITLPPYASRTTTLTFATPGDYLFICHLPGHEVYGMTGLLRVRV